MAAFGIGTNSNTITITIGELHGKQLTIACDCWFIRKGKMLSQYFKYEDENGEIRTIDSIRAISSENKYICGIKTWEFICSTEIENYEYMFKLIFSE